MGKTCQIPINTVAKAESKCNLTTGEKRLECQCMHIGEVWEYNATGGVKVSYIKACMHGEQRVRLSS